MTYVIDDDGIHLIVPPDQPRNPPAGSVGCVFGSVTDAVLPIPLDEAIEKCKEISAWVEAIEK